MPASEKPTHKQTCAFKAGAARVGVMQLRAIFMPEDDAQGFAR